MVAACQMAEVGDEELNDVIPREYKPVGQGLRDIGYYIDEKGVKRYGIIPSQNKFEVKGEKSETYFALVILIFHSSENMIPCLPNLVALTQSNISIQCSIAKRKS